MFNTGHNEKMIEVLSGPERRRRRTAQEKIAIVQQTMEPGMTLSHVARLHGLNANQVFTWRRQYQNGSLTTTMESLSAEYGIILLNCRPMATDESGHYCVMKASRMDFR